MNAAKAFATGAAKHLVTGEPRVVERTAGGGGLPGICRSRRDVALKFKKLLLCHHCSSRLLDCLAFCSSLESRSCTVATFFASFGRPAPAASCRAWNS